MNRIVVLIGLCLFLFGTDRVSGQDPVYTYQPGGIAFANDLLLNDIPAKAYRNFLHEYPFATAEHWSRTGNGFAVRFATRDSAYYHCFYDGKGRFERALTFYAKGTIPDELKPTMKNVLKHYDVLATSALDDGIRKTYEITLTNDVYVEMLDITGDNVNTVYQYRLQPYEVMALPAQ